MKIILLLNLIVLCLAKYVDIEEKEIELISLLMKNCSNQPVNWQLLQNSLEETNKKIVENRLAGLFFDNILNEKVNYLNTNKFSCKEEIGNLFKSLEQLSHFSNKKFIKEAIKTSRKFPNKKFKDIKQFKEELNSFVEDQLPHPHLLQFFNEAGVITTLVTGVLSVCNLGLPLCTFNATVAVIFWSLWYHNIHETLIADQ